MFDSAEPNLFHPYESVSLAAFNATDTLDALEPDQDCINDVTGMFTRPAAHEEDYPRATLTDPDALDAMEGCEAQRVAVDANPDPGTLGYRIRRDTTRTAKDLLANVDNRAAAYGQLMAGSVAVIVPVLIVFIALQRHIIAALLQGSVKG